ncbi:hypothetical protein CPLU01_08128 [Colletotrichum plurivorum]|uniref:Uncharacterized protein n=1 Tax=Colletotrichum plurivorum TaxID=2175906 RepID=A0A8H6NDZ3_9PEZI|nr:hypothetical protein CPLU01_08128 [Colletotrichum plurivorum]
MDPLQTCPNHDFILKRTESDPVTDNLTEEYSRLEPRDTSSGVQEDEKDVVRFVKHETADEREKRLLRHKEEESDSFIGNLRRAKDDRGREVMRVDLRVDLCV